MWTVQIIGGENENMSERASRLLGHFENKSTPLKHNKCSSFVVIILFSSLQLPRQEKSSRFPVRTQFFGKIEFFQIEPHERVFVIWKRFWACSMRLGPIQTMIKKKFAFFSIVLFFLRGFYWWKFLNLFFDMDFIL